MTQAELFEVRQVGNVTLFETSRLVSGIKNTPALTSPGLPPPAPADVLPPFARNSETSRQAAIEKYEAGTAKNQREMIYRFIKFRGDEGATREEIQVKLGLSGDTVRPRICELLGAAKGYAVARIRTNWQTRKTKSGLNAEVLVAI